MKIQDPILQVKNLQTHFHTFEGITRAVDDVSFHLEKGETLGLVGESGCGKSVTALSIMRLVPEPPGRIGHGEIWFQGSDLLCFTPTEMKAVRGKHISMIFQEPMTSLNPVYTIGDQIAEMYLIHEGMTRKDCWDRAVEMLRKVQIPSPGKRAHDHPHQLSGGMRQRVMIAMAMACNPEILIADEPTTALDVTIQAQIMDLMLRLKEDFDTAILMISHNLGVIAKIAKRIAVMYAGKVVEEGKTTAIFKEPKHPYTRGLLRSIPKLGERSRYGRQRLTEIKGTVPNLFDLPEGCSFFSRCPERIDICETRDPQLLVLDEDRKTRCWLYIREKVS
jgi:peptide/nickel transport system ATP-binding protein/oligopeptide transport system ATP-binding protein